MVCAEDWPLSVCSGHGVCVNTLNASLAADPSATESMCVCDSGWTGHSDYVSGVGTHCLTHTLTIRVMWIICAVLTACACAYSWTVVLTALCGCNKAMPPDTVANHRRSGAARGAAAAAGGNDEPRDARDAREARETRETRDIGYRPPCTAVAYHRCVSVVQTLPLRVALALGVGYGLTFVHAMSKLVPAHIQTIGFDVLPTTCSALALGLYWGSTFDGVAGFHKSNVLLLRLAPADRERSNVFLERLRRGLWFAYTTQIGIFSMPFLTLAFPQHQTPFTIVYCFSMAIQFIACLVSYLPVSASLIKILTEASLFGSPTPRRGGSIAPTATASSLPPATNGAANTTGIAPLLVAAHQPQAPTPRSAGTGTAGPAALARAGSSRVVHVAPSSSAAGALTIAAPSPTASAQPIMTVAIPDPAAAPPAPSSPGVLQLTITQSGNGAGGGGLSSVSLPGTTQSAAERAMAERLDLADRLGKLRKALLSISRNQLLIYTVMPVWPMLRNALTYQVPFGWCSAAIAGVAIMNTLNALRLDPPLTQRLSRAAHFCRVGCVYACTGRDESEPAGGASGRRGSDISLSIVPNANPNSPGAGGRHLRTPSGSLAGRGGMVFAGTGTAGGDAAGPAAAALAPPNASGASNAAQTPRGSSASVGPEAHVAPALLRGASSRAPAHAFDPEFPPPPAVVSAITEERLSMIAAESDIAGPGFMGAARANSTLGAGPAGGGSGVLSAARPPARPTEFRLESAAAIVTDAEAKREQNAQALPHAVPTSTAVHPPVTAARSVGLMDADRDDPTSAVTVLSNTRSVVAPIYYHMAAVAPAVLAPKSPPPVPRPTALAPDTPSSTTVTTAAAGSFVIKRIPMGAAQGTAPTAVATAAAPAHPAAPVAALSTKPSVARIASPPHKPAQTPLPSAAPATATSAAATAPADSKPARPVLPPPPLVLPPAPDVHALTSDEALRAHVSRVLQYVSWDSASLPDVVQAVVSLAVDVYTTRYPHPSSCAPPTASGAEKTTSGYTSAQRQQFERAVASHGVALAKELMASALLRRTVNALVNRHVQSHAPPVTSVTGTLQYGPTPAAFPNAKTRQLVYAISRPKAKPLVWVARKRKYEEGRTDAFPGHTSPFALLNGFAADITADAVNPAAADVDAPDDEDLDLRAGVDTHHLLADPTAAASAAGASSASAFSSPFGVGGGAGASASSSAKAAASKVNSSGLANSKIADSVAATAAAELHPQAGALTAAGGNGASSFPKSAPKDDDNKADPSGATGLMKEVQISLELSRFLRLPEHTKLSRPTVVKLICKYVARHGLAQGRNIACDAALQSLTGQETVTFFSINKHMNQHFARAGKRAATTAAASEAAKNRVKKGGGFACPMDLSPELAAVIGDNGGLPMSRPAVVKALWNYIRQHKLQDPNDGRVIHCNDALKKVMGGDDVVNMISMNKLISAHLTKSKIKLPEQPADATADAADTAAPGASTAASGSGSGAGAAKASPAKAAKSPAAKPAAKPTGAKPPAKKRAKPTPKPAAAVPPAAADDE